MVPLPSIQPSTFVLEQLSDLKLVHRLNKFAISCQSCSGHPVSPLKNSKTACNEGTNVPENSLITSVVNLCATWGWSHGITMLQDGKSTFAARLAPYSLIPTPVSINVQSFPQAFDRLNQSLMFVPRYLGKYSSSP